MHYGTGKSLTALFLSGVSAVLCATLSSVLHAMILFFKFKVMLLARWELATLRLIFFAA